MAVPRDYISKLHADLRGARYTRRGAATIGDAAPRGEYKKYSRMPFLEFGDIALPEKIFSDVLNARHSHSGNTPRLPLTHTHMGALLRTLRAQDESGQSRPYPSGGSLYPIETYFIGLLETREERVLHYDPVRNGLEDLWPLPRRFSMQELFPGTGNIVGEPSGVIVLTAVWPRSAQKYGDFAYTLALLEAGHMAQNIVLAAAALGLGARPLAAFEDASIAETLDIQALSEQPVYSVALYRFSHA